MNIIVAIKQVPDTTDAKIDPETHTLIRKGLPNAINSFDEIAIEAAIELKQKYGGVVTLISMGPRSAEHSLKIGLAMGADHAILLSDRAFAGSDTWATSFALAAAIRKIGDFDLLIFGKQSTDGDTAQVGPEVASFLNIALCAYVIEIKKFDPETRTITVVRLLEEGRETIRAKLPALLTVSKGLAIPRYPLFNEVRVAMSRSVETWSIADIGVNPTNAGLNGSPTRVDKIFTPESRHGSRRYSGAVEEMTAELVTVLKREGVLKI